MHSIVEQMAHYLSITIYLHRNIIAYNCQVAGTKLHEILIHCHKLIRIRFKDYYYFASKFCAVKKGRKQIPFLYMR